MLLLKLLFVSWIGSTGANLLGWILGGSEPDQKQIVSSAPLKTVPFESSADDENFLQEAAKYTSLKLSDLDACQHRVVMQIHSSCSTMGDEELAKMSVQLLNCQSRVEGRPEFPCTSKMSLRECTTPMDADTWNTYHLMSNRARAVCYASRHQQFRALSELTVNKLMSSAHDQLAAMAILKEGQHKLESMTLHTLDTVTEGHVELARQQEQLQERQLGLQRSVSASLNEVAREKAMIASTHARLAQLGDELRAQIEETGNQVARQTQEMGERHRQMLADLNEIHRQAQEILQQVESRGAEALSRLALASEAQESALVALARINASADTVLALAEAARREVELRLEWITKLVGGDADKLHCWLAHVCYLLAGMTLAAFLSTPRFMRIALLAVVVGNLCVGLTNSPADSLDFVAMTTLIAAITAAAWVLQLLWRIVTSLANKPSASASKPKPAQGGIKIREHLASSVLWIRQALGLAKEKHDEEPPPLRFNRQSDSLGWGQQEESFKGSDQLDESKAYSVPLRRFIESRDSRSGTPFSQASASRRACAGLRRDGQHCRLSAANGTNFCHHHGAGLTS